MQITKQLSVTEEQITELEIHSLINILTVINLQLQFIQFETEAGERFGSAVEQSMKLADACREENIEEFNQQSVENFRKNIYQHLDQLKDELKSMGKRKLIEESKSVFDEIFTVFEVRLDEIIRRWKEPGKWEVHTIDAFKEDFNRFFYAMEKSSKGRYRIIYNIAEQEEKDYLVQFVINSDYRSIICIPIILKDVIRDLIANARKYTPPGGEINIGILQKEGKFRFVIEDSGYGIPQDEIPMIVEYGYRGTNVKDKIRTMGGGFGLTKAYYVTSMFNGSFWIDSEVNKGTKITIEIPVPGEVRTIT